MADFDERTLHYPTDLGTSEGDVFEATSFREVMTDLLLCNRSGGIVTATIRLIPNAASTDPSRAIVGDADIPAKHTAIMSIRLPMEEGDKLTGYAGAGSSISVAVTGYRR